MAGAIRVKGSETGFTELRANENATDNIIILPIDSVTVASEEYVQIQLEGLELGDLTNVDVDQAEENDLLAFDGEDWVGTSDVSLNSIQMDTSLILEDPPEGMMAWNAEDGTLNIGMEDEVVLQVGQEQFFRVKNQTGVTIPDGTAVGFAGTVGASGILLAKPFIADGSESSEYFMGIATQDILDGEDGYVTHFGKVRGLDLSGFDDGDILYVSPDIAGGLTSTPPQGPNNIIQAAAVIKSGNPGTLMVRPTLGSSLFKDESVNLNNLQDRQLLIWDDSDGVFKNSDLSIAELSDVDEGTGFQDNDTLVYSSISGSFGPGPSIPVTTTDLSEGTNLYYTDARVQAIAAPLYFEENVRTASYTLALSDVAKVVAFNSTSNLLLTVPTNASVAFPIGTVINVYRAGAGAVTISGAIGVTVRNAGVISDQFVEVSLRKRGTDEWVLSGNVD